MCYSALVKAAGKKLAAKLGIPYIESKIRVDREDGRVFPLGKAPFIRFGTGGTREFMEGQFGLVPGWVKDDKGPAFGRNTYNARSETVFEKPSFRKAILSQRAIIAVSGFFERADVANGEERAGLGKVGHGKEIFVSRKDQDTLWIGGIWEWHERFKLASFAFLTTEPLEVLKGLHSRSPLLLNDEDLEAWLDPNINSRDAISRCIKIGPSDHLRVELA